ncbi:HTH-type transcriptional repressor NagR [Leucobacter soli]|uniref:HTH-type transcriptional repressor NagR n=2 Tax=Leucobacter soli TaxID=2812850 RepID=A0A916NJ10_9MICO|nr:HTH-type transcriptional repressor NagR [Leucobacter soli]
MRELVATLSTGQRLPSERELAVRWNVSRMTLRHATDMLVAEGLLVRRQGTGTFVAGRPVIRALGLTSFSQDMRSRGLRPGSLLVSFRTLPADTALAGALQVVLDEPLFQFTRVRLGDGEPLAVETTWLPVASAPGLSEADLSGSLYEVLAKRYGIITTTARIAIEPILPDERVQTLLGIDGGQACLRLRMVDSDADGRVVMVANCVYRGDKYHLLADVADAAGATTGVRP